MTHSGSDTSDVQVVKFLRLESEEEYKAQLTAHNEDVTAYEAHAHKNFVNARVVLVVADLTDAAGAKAKVCKVPMLMEKKRKFFLFQEDLSVKTDWDKIKTRKLSKFASFDVKMQTEDLDAMKEVYLATRTKGDDGQSSDTLMVTVPAPSANSTELKNVNTVARALRTLVPKHQNPKVGHIERMGKVARCKRNSTFGCTPNDNVLFTSEKVLEIPRKAMEFLTGGHTSVNRWPVPEILEQQLARLPFCKFDSLFADSTVCATIDAEDEAAPVADTEHLPEDECIPFPNEMHHAYSLELINVFEPEIMIFFHVGSGEQLKAILETNALSVRAVGVCNTAAHKAWVHANLVEHVKRNRLVSLSGAPKKSEALLEWEGRPHACATPKLGQATPLPATGQTAILPPPPASRNTLPPPPTLAHVVGGSVAATPGGPPAGQTTVGGPPAGQTSAAAGTKSVLSSFGSAVL